jgi:hypothetical protein
MVTAYSSRKQGTLALAVVSTGLFLLAVVFSLAGSVGFYVSLGLVLLGCFSMIALGIRRDASVGARSIQTEKVSSLDSDEF